METMISVVLLAAILTGLILFLRTKINQDVTFSERSAIYKQADKIMNMIRSDLLSARAVTDMEYFKASNNDNHFNGIRPSDPTGHDIQVAVDDPLTFSLFESLYPPENGSNTVFDESRLNYENSPYGITYDYVFGITNSGNMDAIYFRGSITDGNKKVPANICYRLVKKRLTVVSNEEDTGIDGDADENESGYHPVANPDPKGDNFNPIFNGTATEGNGLLDKGEPDRNGNALIDRAHTFELQRITTVLSDNAGDKGIDDLFDNDGRDKPRPATRVEIISKSVVSFDVHYYDLQRRQYVEPETTIKRFSYPPDVGVVGRFGTQTPPLFSFDNANMQTEYFIDNKSRVSDGDQIFLMGSVTVFNLYKIKEGVGVDETNETIEFESPPSVSSNTPIQFIPSGMFTAGGILFCPAVKDSFANLKSGNKIFLQQWNVDRTDFAIKPDLYTIMDKRGGGLTLDLKDQTPLPGTETAFFRGSYLPPSIKITISWLADQLSINRGEPYYLTFNSTIALSKR